MARENGAIKPSTLAINVEEGSMKKMTVGLMVAVSVFFLSIAGASAQALNPQQVALLRWYGGNQAGIQVGVGNGPAGIAFDGANIWVANSGTNNVTKLRANDGGIVGTFSVGDYPQGIAFDGANIWVVNGGSSTVIKLQTSDGAKLGTFSAGISPRGIAFDGANIWVTNQGSNSVSKL